MKQKINENDIFKASMRKVLNEKYYHPSLLKEYAPQQQTNLPYNQINHSDNMGVSIQNGARSAQAQQGLNGAPTTAGRIYNNSQQRGEEYTQVINNLQEKIKYYLNQGYFGQNQTVLNAIQQFVELLSYMNGYYESAVVLSNISEGIGDWMKNKYYQARYPEQNKYGVNQRITQDNSGSQFAVNGDYKGQWMTDLQSLLQEYLKIDYLHGGKTVKATQDFIEFLNVDKRTFLGMLGWDNSAKQKLQKFVRDTTIAITFIASVCGGTSPEARGHLPVDNNYLPTQQVTNQNQNVSSAFEFDSNQITQNMSQTLGQLQPGNYVITITNAHGGNEAYNNNLYQQRANAIKQSLPQGVTATFKYGGVDENANEANVTITQAQTNVNYGAFGENKKYKNKNMKKNTVRLTEAQLHRVIKESVKRVLREMDNEGQGWDMFKSMKKGIDSASDETLDNTSFRDLHNEIGENQPEFDNFIEHGNIDGKPGMDYYDADEPETGSYFNGNGKKPINHSMMGKMGRRAGIAGAKAYGYGRLGQHKLAKGMRGAASGLKTRLGV